MNERVDLYSHNKIIAIKPFHDRSRSKVNLKKEVYFKYYLTKAFLHQMTMILTSKNEKLKF